MRFDKEYARDFRLGRYRVRTAAPRSGPTITSSPLHGASRCDIARGFVASGRQTLHHVDERFDDRSQLRHFSSQLPVDGVILRGSALRRCFPPRPVAPIAPFSPCSGI